MRIKYDVECLGAHDLRGTDQKLVLSNWNPEKVEKGGWREYLTKNRVYFVSVFI